MIYLIVATAIDGFVDGTRALSAKPFALNVFKAIITLVFLEFAAVRLAKFRRDH